MLGATWPSDCITESPTRTSPEARSAPMNPEIWRSSVDLPEPEAPMSATISPGFSSRLTDESAFFGAPKDLERLRMESCAPAVMSGERLPSAGYRLLTIYKL